MHRKHLKQKWQTMPKNFIPEVHLKWPSWANRITETETINQCREGESSEAVGNVHLEFKVMATPAAKSVNLMSSSATILLTSIEMSGGLATPRFTWGATMEGGVNGLPSLALPKQEATKMK